MARGKSRAKLDEEKWIDADGNVKVAREVTEIDLADEVEASYLTYSWMVLQSRAIPALQDGFKPVHRRILWSMYKAGLYPDKPTVKSLRCVSEVTKYHPFGDAAAYQSLVRLGRWHAMSVPLITAQGSFGQFTGDKAAAPRYTESKLAPAAMLCLEETKQDVVDMVDNYDGTLKEPVLLPVEFPNLIVNGSEGIGVGIATHIPPHNPSEAIAATRWLIRHPNASVDKLMSIMPAPDFPTGCDIVGNDELKKAYESGQGTLTMRATCEVNPYGRGRHELVFRGIPYEVSISSILDQIKSGMSSGKIVGVADYKDLSGRTTGQVMQVLTKANVNPKILLAQLYSRTSLETTYPVALYAVDALHGNKPALYGLRGILQGYIDFRRMTVRRRLENAVADAEHRVRIIDGLQKIIADVDEVIAIIRKSKNADTAKKSLMRRYSIDTEQADYVLAIPLRRLTRYDTIQLKDERKRLEDSMRSDKATLADKTLLDKLICDELAAIDKQIGCERRCRIIGADASERMAAEAEEAIAAQPVDDGPCTVNLSASGMVWHSRGADVQRATAQSGPMTSSLASTETAETMVVTSAGRAVHLPNSSLSNRPAYVDALTLGSTERIISAFPLAGKAGAFGTNVAMVMACGRVKLLDGKTVPKMAEFDAVKMADGDSLLAAGPATDSARFLMVTSDAKLLLSPVAGMHAQGRAATGVAGIKLAKGASVVFGAVADMSRDLTLVTVTDTGRVKASALSDYPEHGLGGGGVRCHALLKKDKSIVWAALVPAGAVLRDAGGNAIDIPARSKRDGSGDAMGITDVSSLVVDALPSDGSEKED